MGMKEGERIVKVDHGEKCFLLVSSFLFVFLTHSQITISWHTEKDALVVVSIFWKLRNYEGAGEWDI